MLLCPKMLPIIPALCSMPACTHYARILIMSKTLIPTIQIKRVAVSHGQSIFHVISDNKLETVSQSGTKLRIKIQWNSQRTSDKGTPKFYSPPPHQYNVISSKKDNLYTGDKLNLYWSKSVHCHYKQSKIS